MKESLENLRDAFISAVKEATNSDHLEEIRIEYLGRKGKIAEVMKGLPNLAGEVRREVGQLANDVKQAAQTAFTEAQLEIRQKEKQQERLADQIDITMPGTDPEIGHLHLVTQAITEVVDTFSRLGFVRVRHPEVEWDYYAFEALNLPKDHPARDEWETFFIADGDKIMEGEKGKVVLTPHTSNAQVREIEKGNLPIRMIAINKTYRRQSDISHVPMFHQFEGLMIDKSVNIAELKGTLDFFAKSFFGPDRVTRLRPHHFPFTEPSFEIDISCDVCNGTGKLKNGSTCRMCKSGWHELGGAGMVHPNVLRSGNLDPEEYSGFAFGWGIERTMAMKSGINIDDIRILYRNDLRFLKQF